MTINVGQETKEYLVYETATHLYRIDTKKLEKLKEQDNFPTKIATDIQKRMKQTVDNSSGEFWDESFNEILNQILEITGDKKQ